uniref:Uncharacterized protein n=1 Tax=Meloidogyne enterolobii TaxID=390850 RepID=A0A6V7XAK4_MELEN|nr:unnamed protein product [Meloidogyne enterolobii]
MAYASHYLLHHALLSVVGCNMVVPAHEDLCISYKKDVDLNLKQMVVVCCCRCPHGWHSAWCLCSFSA